MTLIIHRHNVVVGLPDAVLFDIDNTLYSYEPAHQAGITAVRSKTERLFNITPEEFDLAFKKARSDVNGRLGKTASSHSRLLYFQSMLETIGLGSQVLLALDFEQTYWRTFLSHAVLFDDVKELLDDLRIAGIPTAIVTDLTAQIQFRKLVYFGLDRYFDYCVTSEEAGADKPDPAPFRLALQKIAPKGSGIWMIGDHPTNDIRGAREHLGAVTLQKLHQGVNVGKEGEAPDCTFTAFADVRHLLTTLQAGVRRVSNY
ncbi:MAG: HAD family hydrolase [Nitrospira sp.]|nr:HAD family hydrolase [Nitrospira sp.]